MRIKKMYNMVVKINQNCNSTNLIQFYRVHAYQGALEAMLSFYILQIWLIFSPYFATKVIADSNIEFTCFVAVTFILCSLFFTFYMFVIIMLFTKSIKKNIKYIDKKPIEEKTFNKLIKRMKKTSRKIHIFGFFCYIFSSFIVNVIFSIITNQSFIEHICFILMFGAISGGLWNIQDYFADNRLDYRKIFDKYDSLSEKRHYKIEKYLFKNTIIHAFFSCIVMIIVLCAILYFFNVIYYNDVNAKPLFNVNIIQNAYILLFFSIIIYYIRTVFHLYYQKKKKKTNIYKSIDEFKISKPLY